MSAEKQDLTPTYYGRGEIPPEPPAMTREEEDRLFRQYARRHTARVRDLLFRKYLRWAFRLASRYKGPRLEFDDAISVANSALLESLDKFDPCRGFRFTTFATFLLRKRLIEALVSTYPVRVPDSLRKKLRTVRSRLAQLEPDDGAGEPKTLAHVFSRLAENQSAIELGESIPHEEPSALDILEARETRDQVNQAINFFSIREQRIIRGRLMCHPPLPFEVLARQLGIPAGRVSELLDQAVVQLRRQLDPAVRASHASFQQSIARSTRS